MTPDLDTIFPLHPGDEVSDKDLRAILAVATGGPVPMMFPEEVGESDDQGL